MSSEINDGIVRLLERYGRALSTGEAGAIVRCWEVPALVLGDEGAIAVMEPGQIETFFARAGAEYQAQGLASTRPELERIEILTATLAAIDVRWPAFDASGHEKSSERSHYIVQLGKDGEVRIRVALTCTDPE